MTEQQTKEYHNMEHNIYLYILVMAGVTYLIRQIGRAHV